MKKPEEYILGEVVDKDHFTLVRHSHLRRNFYILSSSCLDGSEEFVRGFTINSFNKISDTHTFRTEFLDLAYDKDNPETVLGGTKEDLLNIACKALNANLIRGITTYKNKMTILNLDGKMDSIPFDKLLTISRSIEKLNALFKETFTITTTEDIEKVKEGAKGKLSNGNTFEVFRAYPDNTLALITTDNSINKVIKQVNGIYGIFVLKDAVITQEK